MSKPTEPGYYWLRDGEDWVIVGVGLSPFDGPDIVEWPGTEQYSRVSQFADDAWGGRITQEPAPDPPLPF
jgi:hypothetical protein